MSNPSAKKFHQTIKDQGDLFDLDCKYLVVFHHLQTAFCLVKQTAILYGNWLICVNCGLFVDTVQLSLISGIAIKLAIADLSKSHFKWWLRYKDINTAILTITYNANLMHNKQQLPLFQVFIEERKTSHTGIKHQLPLHHAVHTVLLNMS